MMNLRSPGDQSCCCATTDEGRSSPSCSMISPASIMLLRDVQALLTLLTNVGGQLLRVGVARLSTAVANNSSAAGAVCLDGAKESWGALPSSRIAGAVGAEKA
uniref:Uncharacterized protein n=1 Tax=Tetraselmis chuii TaxID=63592 RepID=A0A7S1SW03_9CHLO